MNQRERFLAIAVGGLVAALGLQWAFSKYRTAVRTRANLVTQLQNQKLKLEEELLQGALADRQMGEYIVRSLPSSKERALGNYQRWLLDWVQSHGLGDAVVDPTSSMPVGDLYQRFGFSVRGTTTLPKLTEFLHSFYAKDYLHRIQKIDVRPLKNDELKLDLSIDAMALRAAPDDLQPLEQTSWRVASEVEPYREVILARNFFSPPNQPPAFRGSSRIDAIVGQEKQIDLPFQDPEGHRVEYALVGEYPEFVTLDESLGQIRVAAKEKGEIDLLVRATDKGYPTRSIEQKLTLTINDPPPPPAPEPAKPVFDDATQTVLTGLVQGRDDWTAWMNVRTRGETLKLRVGDGFEIGSLKGTVIEVNQRFAELEIDGRRFTLRPSGNLAEAAKAAQED